MKRLFLIVSFLLVLSSCTNDVEERSIKLPDVVNHDNDFTMENIEVTDTVLKNVLDTKEIIDFYDFYTIYNVQQTVGRYRLIYLDDDVEMYLDLSAQFEVLESGLLIDAAYYLTDYPINRPIFFRLPFSFDFVDGTKLTVDGSQEYDKLYMYDGDIMLWSATYESIRNVIVENNLIYVQIFEDETTYLVTLKNDCHEQSRMIIDGDLEFVMDDGTIILSKSIFPDVTTNEYENQFYYDSHIVAITPEGNTIFETEIPGIISKVAFMEEQLLVEYRQDAGMLVSYISDEYNNLLINMNGEITYEFSEVYQESKYILQYTDVYCFIASSKDDLRSANYDIFLETDVDGNMINSYQLLMNSFNKYIYYTGTEIKIFDHVILHLY